MSESSTNLIEFDKYEIRKTIFLKENFCMKTRIKYFEVSVYIEGCIQF